MKNLTNVCEEIEECWFSHERVNWLCSKHYAYPATGASFNPLGKRDNGGVMPQPVRARFFNLFCQMCRAL